MIFPQFPKDLIVDAALWFQLRIFSPQRIHSSHSVLDVSEKVVLQSGSMILSLPKLYLGSDRITSKVK